MSENIKTTLYDIHVELGAKIVPFSGYEMPVTYPIGIHAEHQAVRNSAGMFDVSHMGEFWITGEGSLNFLQYVTINDVSKLEIGDAQYSAMCYEDGGIVDDLILYRKLDGYFMVINASNIDKDLEWLVKHKPENVNIENHSQQYSLIAVQGPEVVKKLDKYIHIPDHFECTIDSPAFLDSNVVLARTGYTGEDGVELMINHGDDIKFIDLIDELEIIPCGLGARDTLRLEASLPLYGQELKEDITPVEAGFRWVINFDHEFIGKDNLLDQISTGNHKYIKKFVIDDKIVARYGDTGICGNVEGKVTSGNYSPILKKSIGFILFESKPESDTINLHIRDKLIEGRIIKGKFLSL